MRLKIISIFIISILIPTTLLAYFGLLAVRSEKSIIEIIDQEIGVFPREQRKIFQKFYRTVQKQVRETEGSGLTLVKHTL